MTKSARPRVREIVLPAISALVCWIGSSEKSPLDALTAMPVSEVTAPALPPVTVLDFRRVSIVVDSEDAPSMRIPPLRLAANVLSVMFTSAEPSLRNTKSAP